MKNNQIHYLIKDISIDLLQYLILLDFLDCVTSNHFQFLQGYCKSYSMSPIFNPHMIRPIFHPDGMKDYLEILVTLLFEIPLC